MNAHAIINEGSLSEKNITFYQENGFLIAPDLISGSEIAELKKETANIFRGKRGAVEGLIPVIESENKNKNESQNETDEEVLKKYVAIHFPHKISSVIHEFLFHKGIVDVLTKIVSPNLKCMQSMLFVKAPGKKGQSWHQDEYYIPTRDKSLVGAWIAIDDATKENGCLWIIPGRPRYMMQRVKNESPEYADVDTIDITGRGEPIAVEVKAGSVVFFNGYTLHSSMSNKTTSNFRTALVNHYMSAESMLPWDQDGKLPASEDLRDIVLVAGTDPYSWKGTVDMNKPYLRPDTLNIIRN